MVLFWWFVGFNVGCIIWVFIAFAFLIWVLHVVSESYVIFLIWIFGVFADLLHILSYLPKDFNFVNHTSYIGWREYDQLNFKSLICDYMGGFIRGVLSCVCWFL